MSSCPFAVSSSVVRVYSQETRFCSSPAATGQTSPFLY